LDRSPESLESSLPWVRHCATDLIITQTGPILSW
jgi:hypothetical protein